MGLLIVWLEILLVRIVFLSICFQDRYAGRHAQTYWSHPTQKKIRVRGIEPRAAASNRWPVGGMRGGNVSRYTIPDRWLTSRLPSSFTDLMH